MASWMVHLRIAEGLLAHIPELDAEPFAIGSIAPDSGVPDENRFHYDPPKSVSHCQLPDEDVLYRNADLAFYRRYLLPTEGERSDARYSFLLGYFFHIVTDNLWINQAWVPVRDQWAEAFDSREALVRAVREDWYGLDFIYLRDHPDNFFQSCFLQSELLESYLDFFPAGAIQHNVDSIKQFYQQDGDEVQAAYHREYRFMSVAQMDAFVDDAIDTLLANYAALVVGGADIGDRKSALELVNIPAGQRP